VCVVQNVLEKVKALKVKALEIITLEKKIALPKRLIALVEQVALEKKNPVEKDTREIAVKKGLIAKRKGITLEKIDLKEIALEVTVLEDQVKDLNNKVALGVKELTLKLTPDMRFIVLSYILTKSKVEKRNELKPYEYKDLTELSVLKTVCSDETIIIHEIADIIENLKKDLSQASVDYLKEKAKTLPSSTENVLAVEMIKEQRLTGKGLSVTPCFYTLDILLKSAAQKRQHVLVEVERYNELNRKIDNIKILYGPNEEGTSFKIIKKPEQDITPVLVLKGYLVSDEHSSLPAAEYRKNFEKHGFLNIMLANAAQHAQYPGPENKDENLPADERRTGYELLAKKIGCSRNIPSFFCINHIYADTYGSGMAEEKQ